MPFPFQPLVIRERYVSTNENTTQSHIVLISSFSLQRVNSCPGRVKMQISVGMTSLPDRLLGRCS
jgi:hypothetical protein